MTPDITRTSTDFSARLTDVEASQHKLQTTLDTLAHRISDLNDLLAAWTEAQQMLKAFSWLAKAARTITTIAATIAALWVLAKTGHWNYDR